MREDPANDMLMVPEAFTAERLVGEAAPEY
jgi:hypothetical protein